MSLGVRATSASMYVLDANYLSFRIGYYPPDHSIVTAGPNNLDSFEALLYVCPDLILKSCPVTWFCRELAELLGQVKPPTASREDIEKSGLEVIKPAQLEQYEKESKIASNCTERVCLFLVFQCLC